MRVQLNRCNTRVSLTDEPGNRGIQRMIVAGREIPFLVPALSGHHFFTGVWPPPQNAVDYEPHESRARLTQSTEFQVVYHPRHDVSRRPPSGCRFSWLPTSPVLTVS